MNEIIDPIGSYDQAREALAKGDTVQRCTVPVETWHDVTEIDEGWHTSRYRIIRRSRPR
jgi:hypothetical protein